MVHLFYYDDFFCDDRIKFYYTRIHKKPYNQMHFLLLRVQQDFNADEFH